MGFYSVAVVLTLVTKRNKYASTKQYKNTIQTLENTVNTSTHITKTPIQLSKHTRYKTHTYTHPHITKPIHTHTHTHTHIRVTKEVETTTVQDKHQIK